jgi:acyl-CoA thioester hydrolase
MLPNVMYLLFALKTTPKIMTNRITLPVRWVDIDQYGHVNNARYFDYMTEARATFMAAFADIVETLHFILVDTHCNFKQPIFYPATVILEQSVHHIGNSSFDLHYHISIDGKETTTFAIGSAKMVCFDPLTKTPTPIPKTLRTFLEAHQQ